MKYPKLQFWLVAVAGLLLAVPVVAQGSLPIGTASLLRPGGALPGAKLPLQILSEADVTLYLAIFKLQEAGKWQAADKRINRLSDRILMGHVLYQRYMHPTAYRSKYRELKNWMTAYADHPGATKVYNLALRRQPKGWRSPKKPVRTSLMQVKLVRPHRALKKPILSQSQQNLVRRVSNRIERLVDRERPTQALKLLSLKAYSRLNAVSFDQNLAIIARGYYHAGKDQKALEVATRVTKRSPEKVPYASWWAGLAAWRLGQFGIATDHFTRLAQVPSLSGWLRAAAAYWAARAAFVGKDPARVAGMLEIGARYPYTFYGLLSLQLRDEERPFSWTLPHLGPVELSILNKIPRAHRALALLEMDKSVRAESELKRLTGAPSPELSRALLALVGRANLPYVSLRLGFRLQRIRGEQYDAALYPLPGWTPAGGYKIDHALIFGFMRQESRFMVDALSRRGATGLMQLMPATARFIAGKRTTRRMLLNPEMNIALGQKYIQHLIEDPTIDGNLFYAAVAYNAGPGNLRKWRREIDYRDDPLLFIESVRSRETRDFVERVMTNFWIYRLRLGQATPSLAATVAGEWPVYIPLDTNNRGVGRAN